MYARAPYDAALCMIRYSIYKRWLQYFPRARILRAPHLHLRRRARTINSVRDEGKGAGDGKAGVSSISRDSEVMAGTSGKEARDAIAKQTANARRG